MTLEEIETEYWAWHYHENPANEEIEDEEFDLDDELAAIEARALERAQQREAEQAPPDPGDWEDI